jgi:hypothetical protein
MTEHDLQAVAFPKLDLSQLASLGHCPLTKLKRYRAGEKLFEAGDRDWKFFVVKSGEVEIVDEPGDEPRTVRVHPPGEFTGDVGQLTGRPALVEATSPAWSRQTGFLSGPRSEAASSPSASGRGMKGRGPSPRCGNAGRGGMARPKAAPSGAGAEALRPAWAPDLSAPGPGPLRRCVGPPGSHHRLASCVPLAYPRARIWPKTNRLPVGPLTSASNGAYGPKGFRSRARQPFAGPCSAQAPEVGQPASAQAALPARPLPSRRAVPVAPAGPGSRFGPGLAGRGGEGRRRLRGDAQQVPAVPRPLRAG